VKPAAWACVFAVASMTSGHAMADQAVEQGIGYRPGFYRMATMAAFVGRVRVDSATPVAKSSGEPCGVVHEATVIESIAGAPAGMRLRFIAQVEPGRWPVGADHFAMLFAHAIEGHEAVESCWLAPPLFAAADPASVVPFDRQAGATLGGEFLPVAPDNMLEGLRFAGVELWRDGKGQKLVSWDLVRAYTRQLPAVLKAMPTLPDRGSADEAAPQPESHLSSPPAR
jgi:hypothetical protein